MLSDIFILTTNYYLVENRKPPGSLRAVFFILTDVPADHSAGVFSVFRF